MSNEVVVRFIVAMSAVSLHKHKPTSKWKRFSFHLSGVNYSTILLILVYIDHFITTTYITKVKQLTLKKHTLHNKLKLTLILEVDDKQDWR